jgi:hypothetical protein
VPSALSASGSDTALSSSRCTCTGCSRATRLGGVDSLARAGQRVLSQEPSVLACVPVQVLLVARVLRLCVLPCRGELAFCHLPGGLVRMRRQCGSAAAVGEVFLSSSSTVAPHRSGPSLWSNIVCDVGQKCSSQARQRCVCDGRRNPGAMRACVAAKRPRPRAMRRRSSPARS